MKKFYCQMENRQLTETEIADLEHCGRCQFSDYTETLNRRLKRNEPLRFNRLEVIFRNGFKPI